VEPQLTTDLPVSIAQNEFMLRMEEMSRTTGEANMFFMPGMNKGTIVFNSNHPSVGGILKMEDAGRGKLIDHLYDIALLMQGKLEGDALTGFIRRDIEFLR
jgi:molecular chaperone HtpG